MSSPAGDFEQYILREIATDFADEPSFPTCLDAAILVRNALRDPEVSLIKIGRAVSIEPLISSKVLRCANSTAYLPGGPPITQLNHAISRLGFELVRTLSLAVALDQMLRTPKQGRLATWAKQIWEHAIHQAALSRVLASHIGRFNAEEAMLAGLVCHIGAFYLLYLASRPPYQGLDSDSLAHLLARYENPLGRHLMRHLGLPATIIEAVSPPQTMVLAPQTQSDIQYFARLMNNRPLPWTTGTPLSDQQQADQLRYQELILDAEAEIDELHRILSSPA